MEKFKLALLVGFSLMFLISCGNSNNEEQGDEVVLDGAEPEIGSDIVSLSLTETNAERGGGTIQIEIFPNYDEEVLEVNYDSFGGEFENDTSATVGDNYFDSFDFISTYFSKEDVEKEDSGNLDFSVSFLDGESITDNVKSYFSEADAGNVREFYNEIVGLFQEEQY